MNALNGLEPRKVLSIFEMLSDIPRGSQNEKQVSDAIMTYVQAKGLTCSQDDMYNLLIFKPGTAGYEQAPSLILHGHMDMVCKKIAGSKHDFLKDGIRLVTKDGWVHGDGTTLGADNGIGVSYILALLDSDDIPHPPLEVVLTVMEEMGKAGANRIDVSRFTGKRMIDLNWHKDDYLLAGCAGDISMKYRVPIVWENASADARAFELKIGGLKGGHCEFDIVLERANAILLLARMLRELTSQAGALVCGLSGGVQNNVIPSEAEASLLIPAGQEQTALRVVGDISAQIAREYRVSDPDITISFENAAFENRGVYSGETLKQIVSGLMLIPNGVMSMSMEIPGISECSNNIGLLTASQDEVVAVCTITSGVTSRKYEAVKRIAALAELAGHGVVAEVFGTDAPEWPYNPDSALLSVAKTEYLRLFGEPSGVEVMPASLELGLFKRKIPGLDILSIGTRTNGVHTPSESMYLPSVAKTWALFKAVVAQLR